MHFYGDLNIGGLFRVKYFWENNNNNPLLKSSHIFAKAQIETGVTCPMEIFTNAKLNKHYKCASEFEAGLLAAKDEMKEYIKATLDANQLLRKLNEKGHKKFPDDYNDYCKNLVGRYYDPFDTDNELNGKARTTLIEATGEDTGLFLGRVFFFVGKAGAFKTTLLHSLGRDLTYRMQGAFPNVQCYGMSSALDPFGVLTKNDMMKNVAAFMFSDVEMKSRISCWLTPSEVCNFFSVEEEASIPARYNVATFPEFRPVMISVNSGGDNGSGAAGAWFDENNVSILKHLLDDSPVPANLTEISYRLLRRVVVFHVEDFLLDVGEGSRTSTRAQTLIDAMRGRSGCV